MRPGDRMLCNFILYASKKFFTQRSITSHLVAVFWQLSGMASSFISWDEMWIFKDPN